MHYCPRCNNELVPDPNNPGKYLCYQCKKRYTINDQTDPFASMQQPPMAGAPASYQQPQAPMGQYPQQGAYPATAPVVPALPKGMAIAALVLGIASIVLSFLPPLAIILGIVGVVLSILSLKKVKKGIAGGKGMSIGGIITSAIGIVVSALLLIFTLFVAAQVTDKLNEYNSLVGVEEIIDDYENMNLYMDDEEGDTASNAIANMSTNSNSGSSQGTAQSAASTGAWTDMTFSVNGKSFALGKSTVSELLSTGIALESASGYVVNPNQELSMIDIVIPGNDGYATISAGNTTSGVKSIEECVLTGFTVTSYDADLDISTCGIKMGDPLSMVEQKLGVPYDSFTGDSYSSVTYQTDDYSKNLRIGASKDGVTEIALSLYL